MEYFELVTENLMGNELKIIFHVKNESENCEESFFSLSSGNYHKFMFEKCGNYSLDMSYLTDDHKYRSMLSIPISVNSINQKIGNPTFFTDYHRRKCELKMPLTKYLPPDKYIFYQIEICKFTSKIEAVYLKIHKSRIVYLDLVEKGACSIDGQLTNLYQKYICMDRRNHFCESYDDDDNKNLDKVDLVVIVEEDYIDTRWMICRYQISDDLLVLNASKDLLFYSNIKEEALEHNQTLEDRYFDSFPEFFLKEKKIIIEDQKFREQIEEVSNCHDLETLIGFIHAICEGKTQMEKAWFVFYWIHCNVAYKEHEKGVS